MKFFWRCLLSFQCLMRFFHGFVLDLQFVGWLEANIDKPIRISEVLRVASERRDDEADVDLLAHRVRLARLRVRLKASRRSSPT